MDPEIERRVQGLLPQARSEAWGVFHTAPHALELDELISLAYKGLWEAARRWPAYCEQKGHDPAAYHYFSAYCLRRIRGSMLDAMRSMDWLTRSMRTRMKALRDAGADLGKTDAELAEATGLTLGQVRETLAAQARRPASFDAEPAEIAEPAGVEESAVVSSILAAVAGAIDTLSEEARTVLALRYYAGWDISECAEALMTDEATVTRLHAEAVEAVHQAMLRSAT